MKLKIANYYRHGYTISRRAFIAKRHNEHPMTYWMKLLGLDKLTLKKILIYVGFHHTGKYVHRTNFYRLPRLDNDQELQKLYLLFISIPATKRKFIKFMAEYLQEEISGAAEFVEQKPKISSGNYVRLRDIF